MQSKIIVLTKTEPFIANDATTRSFSIEIDLDNYCLDSLAELSDKLKNCSVKEVNLHIGHIPSEENQKKIVNFISNLRHVESIAVSNSVMKLEHGALAETPPFFDLAKLALQVNARNRLLSQFNVLDCVDPAKTIVNKWVTLNHNSRHKLHYLTPGKISELKFQNACFIEMGDWFFQNVLAYFPCHINQWVVNHVLNETQLACLTQYVQQANNLPFERLALYVDRELIETGEFQPLLQALSNKSLRGLTLLFSEKELTKENLQNVATRLEQTVVPHANFLVKIALQTNDLAERRYEGQAFRSFEKALISHIQQVNSGEYSSLEMPTSSTTFFTGSNANASTKKIALKNLLGKGKVPPKEIRGDFENTSVRKEVQYVAVQQQQAVVQTVASQVQTINQTQTRIQQTQQTIAGVYDGKLVDFFEFSGARYRNIALEGGCSPKQIDDLYRVVQQEFFANMPHAIKYVSQQAAQVLAENLPQFCALNADNLPENSHFVLKQTPRGEIVLDINPYVSCKKVNAFTLKAYQLPAHQSLMYSVDLSEQTVKNWIKNDRVFRSVCYPKGIYDTQKLQNLWAKFGEVGAVKLFDALNSLDKRHPGFSEFLVSVYLNYFPDWEIFLLPQTDFFNSLDRLRKYNDTQLTCLKKFIVNSGCSQHHLTSTLDGFDAFWENVSALCQERSVNIADINSDWHTSTGYIPVFLPTPERLKELKVGEFAITAKNFRDYDLDSNSTQDPTLTCHIKNEKGEITQFDFSKNDLTAAWMKKNPCIFIQAKEVPDKDILAKLPCAAYIHVENTIYYFDYKKRNLLSTYDFTYDDLDDSIVVQELTKDCKYTMEAILEPINQGYSISSGRMLTPTQLSTIYREIYHAHNSVYQRLFIMHRKELCSDELELIWLDVLALAAEKNYVQLKSGHPIVYMQRLWGILEKARDLSEQCVALDSLTLDNYSAPYASKFEPFKVVSSGMDLCYRPDQQNAQPFSISMQCYFIGFEALLTNVFCLDNDNFNDVYLEDYFLRLSHLCRLVGQAEKGISINRYRSEIQVYNGAVGENLTLVLFFLMHEKYEGKISLKKLVGDYVSHINNYGVILDLAKQLKHFFEINIFLSDVESVPLLEIIGGMNSLEFEREYGNSFKGTYVEKMFNHLEKNKYGMFKLLQKLYRKQAFIHVLDILDYWNMNYSVLAARYKEDLPLFALLIKDFKYSYKKNYLEEEQLKKLESITGFLMSAIQKPYPNNYAYAFELIVNGGAYFDAADFIAVFVKMEKLEEFDSEMVNSILKEYELLSSIRPPSINHQCYLQETLIDLIFSLNHFISTGDFLFNPPPYVSEKDFENITNQEDEIDAKLEFFHSRIGFLNQTSSNPSEDNYSYQNYSCCFFTTVEGKPDIEELKEYPLIYFPAIFKYQRRLKEFQWLAYIDENGEAQCKKLEGVFTSEEHLNEIKTSARHYLKEADASKQLEVLAEGIHHCAISRRQLTVERQRLQEKAKIYQEWEIECTRLRKLSMKDLNKTFFDLWETQTFTKKMLASPLFHAIFDKVKQVFVTDALSQIGQSESAKKLQVGLVDLSDFKGADDFNKLQRAINHAEKLAISFKKWLETQSFITYEKDFIALFSQMDYPKWSSELLLKTVDFISELNPHDYRNILKQLFQWYKNNPLNTNKYLQVLDKLQQLFDNNLSINTLNQWVSFICEHIESKELESILLWIIKSEKSNDPLLIFVSNHLDLYIRSITKLIELTETLSLKEKVAVVGLFEAILSTNNNQSNGISIFLDNLSGNQSASILKLIASCQAIPIRKQQTIDYNTLAQKLSALSAQNFVKIERFCQESVLNIQNFSALVAGLNANTSIEACISSYEKAPFGPRDFKAQFDTSELSRIVNGITDLKHRSTLTYQARKQLMEAVLYVNDLGQSLPAYYGKPAKELSDAQIKTLFAQLKNNKFKFPNLFTKQLYVLALLREAFYRKAGEFAYCSQLASIIGAMQQPDGQHVLQQIDTGEGKTLSDTLKAVLLWLDHEGGEVVTSSRADANRDHSLFLPSLRFVGVPVADKAITQTSDFDEFKSNGINYSTPSDLALFYQRTEVCEKTLRPKNAKSFMVLSEADRATLDDHTIFRYAEFDPDGIGSENEWLYDGIHDFVRSPEFKADKTSESEDILALRRFLSDYATRQSQGSTILSHLTDEQLLTWIQSTIVVKRLLQKDMNYLIRPGQKKINGHLKPVFEVKIIQEIDNRVDEDAVYDKTIQPLLCAYLNRKLKGNEGRSFVIEPSTKTILASNSKNLIQKYAKTGVIWGSTGTAGSREELDEQAQTYGFVCFGMPSYRKNQVEKNPVPQIVLNKDLQYAAILQHIQIQNVAGQRTAIVAWHDIPKAKAFYDWLKLQGYPESQLQHYTDQDAEQELVVIQNAPNKITSSTRGLGRNTNIAYAYDKGMLVIQTEPDTLRNTRQLAGRTGRQGSKGTFLRIFNVQDFPDETVEQVIKRLEETSKQRRDNETFLFDVFAYLLNHVDGILDAQQKAQFLKNVWGSFSEQLEAEYRGISTKEIDEKNKFILKAIDSFNRTVSTQGYSKLEIETAPSIANLTKKYPPLPPYQIYDEQVEQSDCIPTSIIAYQALPTQIKASTVSINADNDNNNLGINLNIQALFENINSLSGYLSANVFQTYLLPLMSNDRSCEALKSSVKDELTQFFNKKLQENSQVSWFGRAICGVRSHLEELTDNQPSLILLTALASNTLGNNEGAIDFSCTQQIAMALLTNYLANSWFISADKCKAAEALIENLKKTKNIEGLINLLLEQKTQVLNQDINLNQHHRAFWQPDVNKKGSRFQFHIDQALLFLTSLQSKPTDISEKILNELLDKLNSVVALDQQEKLNACIAKKDFDSIKSLLPTLRFRDEHNAKVILDSLNKWLNYQLHSDSFYTRRNGK